MELVYWNGLPGRGEFIRLLLEWKEQSYLDSADSAKVMALRAQPAHNLSGFAPPYLVVDGLVLSQTANIAMFVARDWPKPEGVSEFQLNQSALSIMDLVEEVHRTHHPIDTSKFYADQKEESKRFTAQFFTGGRLGKWMAFFETQISKAGGMHLFGAQMTYPDVMLFQLVDGIRFAFPNRTQSIFDETPLICSLVEAVRTEPTIKAYLASNRRRPFSENGIFRRLPELDSE